MSLDRSYTFTLTIGGTDVWLNLVRGTVNHVALEAGEISTLSFDLVDHAEDLSIADRAEVIWTATSGGSTKLFGGYVVKIDPHYRVIEDASLLFYTISCEGYETKLKTAPEQSIVYVDQTSGYIVDDLFTQAGLSAFGPDSSVSHPADRIRQILKLRLPIKSEPE